MTDYLQNDPRWKDKIYQSGLTFGKFGCFVTSLGNMVGLDPVVTAQKLVEGGGLVNGLVSSPIAAIILNLNYDGKTNSFTPTVPVIAETNYYGNQHFFIINPDGSQIDPLGKNIKYPIVSYRLFTTKGNQMNHEQVISTIRDARNSLFGHLDNPGAENDAKWVDGEFAKGNQYALGQMMKTYANSAEFKNLWMKKKDCKPTVCPPVKPCPPCPVQDCESAIKAEQVRIINNLVK